jgi:hypothetical protein
VLDGALSATALPTVDARPHERAPDITIGVVFSVDEPPPHRDPGQCRLDDLLGLARVAAEHRRIADQGRPLTADVLRQSCIHADSPT